MTVLDALEDRKDAKEHQISFGFLLVPDFTMIAFAGFLAVLRQAGDVGDQSRQRLWSWTVVVPDCNSVAGGQYPAWRAGVEATVSELDRLTGIKKLRVRGFGAVRFCAIMKAAGLNLLRAAKVRRVRAKALAAKNVGLIFLNQPPVALADFKLAA